MQNWLIFLASAAVIIMAGRKLSDYGDEISEVTGLGKVFIGSVLLAASTSLPEVATSAAAAYMHSDNLAMGNVFGSNTFNMVILVLAQLAARRPVLANVQPSHISVAAAGILLAAVATMTMLVKSPASFLGVGVGNWLIILIYLFSLKILPKGQDSPDAAAQEPAASAGSGKSAAAVWLKFGAAAAVTIAGGYFLSTSADAIAAATGLGQTFVGSTLLAACTSLPEVTVTIACARRGAYDLAVGNVLGSNIFNMTILFVADLAKPGGVPIYMAATAGQVTTALLALILSGIVIFGLAVRERTSPRPFQWDAWSLAATYLAGTYLLFVLR